MTEDRPARARAEYNPHRDSVGITVSPRRGTLLLWEQPIYNTNDDEATVPPAEAYLHLREDVARAMYEALGQYFGGDVVDARRLRQDYDHERARVDKFIDATIRTITAP